VSTGWNNKPVAVDTAAIAVAVAAAVDVPTAADNATAVAAELATSLGDLAADVAALPTAAENATAVAGALTIPSAADNATAVAAELDTTLTAISDDVVALAPPVLSYATGNLGPADFTVIPAVGGQVITVYGFVFWSVDGAARKLAYTNADGSHENYYHASDLNITSNGIDPRSSVITMTPTGRPLYVTHSGKTFSAIGDGDLQFMIWYTQA
jgi:hypothetical protein